MRIKTKNTFRIWIASGDQKAGTYKDADLLIVESRGEADRLHTLLRSAWETAVQSGIIKSLPNLLSGGLAASGADNIMTPHQMMQQITARRVIASTFQVDDETAFLLFRVFAELGVNNATMGNRRSGVAQTPVYLSTEPEPTPTPAPAEGPV